MTASLRKLRVRSAFTVDHVKVKNLCAPIATADLLTPSGKQRLWQWLENSNVVGVFLAPPCGASSRARAIRLNSSKKRKNKDRDPVPLRSDRFPNGLPSLSAIAKERVRRANALYVVTSDVVS